MYNGKPKEQQRRCSQLFEHRIAAENLEPMMRLLVDRFCGQFLNRKMNKNRWDSSVTQGEEIDEVTECIYMLAHYIQNNLQASYSSFVTKDKVIKTCKLF